MQVRMHTCLHVFVHVCGHMCTSVYAMRVCACVCMCACVYVCVHVFFMNLCKLNNGTQEEFEENNPERGNIVHVRQNYDESICHCVIPKRM